MTDADLTTQPSPEEHGNEAVPMNDTPPDAETNDVDGAETTPLPASAASPVDDSPLPYESTADDESTVQDAVAPAVPLPVQPARRSPTYRPTTLVVGILLIALGVILVWPVFSGGYILVIEVIAAIIIAGIALSLLAFWLNTGRRARGAFFLAILGLLWAGLAGVLLFDPSAAATGGNWPFYIVALGGALLATYIGDRQHDARLILPSAITIAAGLAALAVTKQLIPPQTLAITQRFWPWLAAIVILGMLPLAIRRASHQE